MIKCDHKLGVYCSLSKSSIQQCRRCDLNRDYCTKVRNYDFNFQVHCTEEGESTFTLTYKRREVDGIYRYEIPNVSLKDLNIYSETPETYNTHYYIQPHSELRFPLSRGLGNIIYSVKIIMKRMTRKELSELGYEVL